jgi:hypothetical protein
MNSDADELARAVKTLLMQRGLLSSAEMQRATGKSQPSMSRALAALAPQVQALGRARGTRYALLRDIVGHAASQPVFFTDEAGAALPWGELLFIEGQRLHVRADGYAIDTQNRLPWFLEPLRPQGFLGRLRGSAMGFADGNPEHWSLEQLLYVLLAFEHDGPGAFSLGEMSGELLPEAPLELAARAAHYDALARDVAQTLPAGSSAGGEQPKFLAHLNAPGGYERLIVKFTPPRGTPFGERWHDLLHAEMLALQTLQNHGIVVATARIVESAQRTYLESVRFDRIGMLGKRHAVPLGAVHQAFIGSAQQHWATSCDTLAAQGRLPLKDATAVRLLRAFGQLIGNTDMHFGNLSLWLDDPRHLAAPQFRLAPVYDMLPMAYRPGEFRDDMGYTPLVLAQAGPGMAAVWEQASGMARMFWTALAAQPKVSREMRALAEIQSARL